MKIELREITVREIVEGYFNDAEEGVGGFGGKLNIRPKYQREFIYDDKKRNAVIDTISKGFPLNVMYWAKSDDGMFEVMDGQQRTISFCEYVAGSFSVDYRYFHNLEEDEKQQILDYKLFIYVCDGTDSEKLDWFKIINIAGEKLTDQELRNAVYSGPWLTDAKRYFSKTGCAAYEIGKSYMSGSPIRQDYLETVIDWISEGQIAEYMAQHQHEQNANALWLYYQSVINWVKATFPHYRREMKGIEWGALYNKYGEKSFDTDELEARVKTLMMDDDVTNKKGIYKYLLTGEEKHLNIRAFSPAMKREAYERQDGICPDCGNHFAIEEMDGDHHIPWHLGGKTIASNCKMRCIPCNRSKGGK